MGQAERQDREASCAFLQAELVKQGSRVPPGLAVALPPATPGGALGVTLERSKQLCLQMYEKELFSETSYESMTGQLVCSAEQLAVFAGERAVLTILIPQVPFSKHSNLGKKSRTL